MSEADPAATIWPASPGEESLLDRLRREFDGYLVIRRELGRGGMAIVYLADDLRNHRPVALKVLRPELGQALGADRFHREVRIVGGLQHPNIVTLFDSGHLAGLWYFIMPYVEGETLRARLQRERQLTVADTLRIARDVASALDYAHRKGVLHRDIKPENILLDGERALVADFGIARAVTAAADAERITETGIVVGTPQYMSPEQGGSGSLDARSDVYSLGCVVFEMLAGQPPFTGATAQAVIARHMRDEPPALQVVRPTVTSGMVRAVNTALAKVPADRYARASEFVTALETPLAAPARWKRWVVGGIGAAVVLATVWQLVPVRRLDVNRVVVFPLHDPGGAGADVATYIGHVLDGSEPLKWEEGREVVAPGQAGATLEAERRLSRADGARFFIDGSILRAADSVTVILRLYDVAADSMVRRAGLSGPAGTSEPRLAARTVALLLPALLGAGRTVDVGALSERAPAAIANFLQGERAYRRSRFAEALGHYQAAVAGDSLFALAAMKGALAANWLDRGTEEQDLTALALARERLLPGRYAPFAQGLRSYQTGSADSAVVQFQRALRVAPDWAEGHMALGEVYYHLLPRATDLDSLAEREFHASFALDSGFSPPLYHLAEIAVRQNRPAEAQRLGVELGRAQADSTLLSPLDLILRCASEKRDPDWAAAAARSLEDVLTAGRVLSAIPSSAGCAEEAYRTILAIDSAPPAATAAALYGLQTQLVEQGRYDAVRDLLSSDAGTRYGGSFILVVDALADPAFEVEADRTVEQWGRDYGRLNSRQLWLAGVWAAHQGRPVELLGIRQALQSKIDSTGMARDSLFLQIVDAHTPLAGGDSTAAVNRLSALGSRGGMNEIAWYPWSALAHERLTLMRLLAARGDFAGVLREGSAFDSPQPVAFLLYRRAVLGLRITAAESTGDARLARRLREIGAAIDTLRAEAAPGS